MKPLMNTIALYHMTSFFLPDENLDFVGELEVI